MKTRISLLLILIAVTHSTRPEHNEYLLETREISQQDRAVAYFAKQPPLRFTRSGIRCFLRHTFSLPEYAEVFLPYNFCHFVEFLEFGRDTQQGMVYIQSSIRLFANKIKECSYVSSYAFQELTEQMPKLLEHLFIKKNTGLLDELQVSIKQTLYDTFLSGFSYFRQEPEKFFTDLSGEILEEISKSSLVQEHVNKEQLRQTILRFLDLTLNKVIWSPLDQEHIWADTKAIAKHLEALQQADILKQDELDDLFQSLVSRFVHFLQLGGSELSLELIQTIRDDIHHGKLLFLTMEEQEEFITTKADRLRKALEETEAKIFARKKGIITEVLPK